MANALHRVLRGDSEAFELRSIMLELRRQRFGMLQTKDQVLFVYLCILDTVTAHFTDTHFRDSPLFHAELRLADVESMLADSDAGTCLFWPFRRGDVATDNDECACKLLFFILFYFLFLV